MPTFKKPIDAKLRLRDFWLTVVAARHQGDHARLAEQFLERACESGLVKALADVHAKAGRPRWWGKDDAKHVISWGLRGMNPWGESEFPDRR